MRNETETFEAAQPDDVRREIEEMRASVEMARSDIRRTKSDVTRYQEEHVRRTRTLWVILVLLTGCLAWLWWYGSPILKENQVLLSTIPGLQSTLDTVSGRITSTEEKIGTWANDRLGFSDRMSKIENTVGSNLKTVRNEARLMAQRSKAEIGQSLHAIQNRISGVESIQREHGEETARLREETGRLQNELEGVRRELSNLRDESARQIKDVAVAAHESTRSELTGLDQRLNSNQNAVSALNYQVDRQRVDFELQNGRTQQVTGDIYVTVKQTDIARQQVDGWVQIAGDGRIVWVRGAGAQKPIEFAGQRDARPYQLVFTRIGRSSTAGYILAPITSAASASPN